MPIQGSKEKLKEELSGRGEVHGKLVDMLGNGQLPLLSVSRVVGNGAVTVFEDDDDFGHRPVDVPMSPPIFTDVVARTSILPFTAMDVEAFRDRLVDGPAPKIGQITYTGSVEQRRQAFGDVSSSDGLGVFSVGLVILSPEGLEAISKSSEDRVRGVALRLGDLGVSFAPEAGYALLDGREIDYAIPMSVVATRQSLRQDAQSLYTTRV